MERDPSEVGNGTAAAGWRYVGLEYVAGRPTHHVACVGDLWIDIETRLILRTQGPAVDDAGQPIPVESTEVTEIAFGEQPAALFEPPEGLARISEEEYSAYICARDLPNELVPGISDCPSTEEAEATPPPEPSPTPMPTEPPDTSDCAVPPGDPSEPTGPLAWTPESLKEDWPAPVRPEPAGGGGVQPIPLTYLDPIGDSGSNALPLRRHPRGDGRHQRGAPQARLEPAMSWIPPMPGSRMASSSTTIETACPTGDTGSTICLLTRLTVARTPECGGRICTPAKRMPARTLSELDPPPLLRRGPKTEYPRIGSDAVFLFGGARETTTGSAGWGIELDMPFYTWASVIVDGRVVATDYAPDAGWLVATRGVRPGGTFLLGDPFPHLSMTVPEGWTMSSTQPGRLGGEGELKRVACREAARDVPVGRSDDADCAGVRFDVIDDSGGALRRRLDRAAPRVQPRRSRDLCRRACDHRERRRDGRWLPREALRVLAGRWKILSTVSLSDSKDVWILDVDGVRLMIGSAIRGDQESGRPRRGSEGRDPADGGVDPLRTLTRHRVHRHTANRGRQG